MEAETADSVYAHTIEVRGGIYGPELSADQRARLEAVLEEAIHVAVKDNSPGWFTGSVSIDERVEP